METLEQTPVQLILFFVLYGVTGVVPLLAALYLLLRRANAITAQQLASESGYSSYSTFSTAFKQRTGLSVTVWMRNTPQ